MNALIDLLRSLDDKPGKFLYFFKMLIEKEGYDEDTKKGFNYLHDLIKKDWKEEDGNWIDFKLK